VVLKISDELSRVISTKSLKIKAFHPDDIERFVRKDKDFSDVIEKIKVVLEKNLFVTIKNIGFLREKSLFEAFVKQFGEYYGAVEYTDIKLECLYTGCNYNRINFHNDDAVDIDKQPKYGFIQVENEDPLKITQNYIVKVDDIIEYLELYNSELLEALFAYKIPMLSYGVNYDSQNNNEIIVNESIFYKDETNIKVRFDTTRIKHYYWKKNIVQSLEERKLIYDFLQVCEKFSKKLYLEKGDIFIHNNHRTLHDRGDCSMELLEDKTFNTREIFVSFAR